MTIRDSLSKLLKGGQIRHVTLTKTIIDHDASTCDDSCRLCRQVAQELKEFWEFWKEGEAWR